MKRKDVPIASPCEVRLGEMPVRSRSSRFCSSCRKEVHDLSKMTEREARSFVTRNSGGDVCVSYGVDSRERIVFAATPARQRASLPLALGVATALAGCAKGESDGRSSEGSGLVSPLVDGADNADNAPPLLRLPSLEDCDLEAFDRELAAARGRAKSRTDQAKIDAEAKVWESTCARDKIVHFAGMMADRADLPTPSEEMGPKPKAKKPSCDCPPGDPYCDGL